jgi:hypothetical protein
MIQAIKKAVFELAPESMQRKFILKRTGKVTLHNEAMDGVHLTMHIAPGALWEKRLSQKNGHEPGICEWIKKNLKADDVFFDIGTLYGFFPALVTAIHPSVQVHCFEMNWFSVHYLNMNRDEAAKKYSSKPWKVNEQMVSDQFGENRIVIDAYAHANHAYPIIVKMDIDGGEVDAMRGMKRLLANKKTSWVIEIHPAILAKQSQSFEQILELIPEGYAVNYLPLIREDNTQWTSDYKSFDHHEEFYVSIVPKNRS